MDSFNFGGIINGKWNGVRCRLRYARPVKRWLVLLVLLAGCSKPSAPTEVNLNAPFEVVIPKHGLYTGAFIEGGEAEENVTLETIESFEAMVGKHQAIIASSSFWGEQDFPTENLNVIWAHRSLPFIFWSPWDRPYEENKGPDRFSLTSILEGKWDKYIDNWADSAKAFGKPVFVSFANEMNGSWFPWSGIYYGGDQLADASGKKWKGPEIFKAAYRHVVDRVRARGAINIKWVFQTNNYSYPLNSWNMAPSYYPGSDYVDWLGLSVYGKQFKEEGWSGVEPLIDWPYKEMNTIDPTKPILIAEWGTGEFPASGNKAAWIKEGLELFRTRYPQLKAAIYWDERWQNEDGSYSNLRVNSSVEALNAYREGVAHPDWIGDLILKPARPGPAH